MPSVDPFAPARLGPVTLRNRIIKAATFEGVMPEALVTPELIDYHRAVAAGGAGLSTVAYLAVAPEGRTHAECIWLRPDAVPGLRQLTDAIHAEGAAAGAQIGHAGPVANSRSNKAASIAPTRRFNPLAMRVIRSATGADIARITNDYARAARLAAESGFDAIEIHLGHNYLLSAFLSPNLNKRTDSWGGSLENRARFPRQAVQAVRAAAGRQAGCHRQDQHERRRPRRPQRRREPRVRPDAAGRRRTRRPRANRRQLLRQPHVRVPGRRPPRGVRGHPSAPRPARVQAGRSQAHARIPLRGGLLPAQGPPLPSKPWRCR